LTKLLEKDEGAGSYTLSYASQFRLQDNINAFVAAFRNIGDGAGRSFVLITKTTGSYRVTW
jgi:hypothetical protein